MTSTGDIETPVQRPIRREVNDRIIETYATVASHLSGAYEECELFCECARPCIARIVVPAAAIVAARGAGMLLVSPGHTVAAERVVAESRDYWVVESGEGCG
jgi:hypothetical protein